MALGEYYPFNRTSMELKPSYAADWASTALGSF